MIIHRFEYIQIHLEEGETEAVRLAVTNLRRDLYRVLNCSVNTAAYVPRRHIYVGTIGVSKEIEERVDQDLLKDAEGRLRREAYMIRVNQGELTIAGTDRRGTIYGIYEFCRKQLGVSPWYFFADVPVRQKESVELAEDFCEIDYPLVEYRGIFINDEEELEHWVQRYMGEDTIGVKTYEKIFELLLRLKMNYIWPAMHVNSFNLKRENGELADRMGIVVGTSHCDMLMRSNNREWKPWLAGKGYQDVEYDYSLPGRNREILEEYWRESIEQNQDFEVSYTLGMRGIHDSGFETRTLAGKSGKELLEAKIELLDAVINTQESLLEQVLGTDRARRDTLKTFVPYKEVLELYDNGLEVPEDLTLIWVNDNYGYVRRYPGEREKNRKSGNGIYYHNSYWAPPGGSYLFICSIPLSHTRNELKKAYAEGIRKLWVTNFGAMKPLEQQMSFYAQLAWEVGRDGAITDDEEAFLESWIDENFSGGHGKELAPILTAFDQLTNARKLEQMDVDAFSQTAYGDEAAVRLYMYERMFLRANAVYETLPRQERDAFFQMVLMKIHAAYYTNAMYYYADRSNLCIKQGKYRAADVYTERCREFDRIRRSMLYYYNHVMSNGKWNGILTPEDFPPPRTAMHPACMPALHPGTRKMVVTLWNEGEELSFVKPAVKWLEIANAGEGEIPYQITAPLWVKLSEVAGTVEWEKRILVEIDWEKLPQAKDQKAVCTGIIQILDTHSGNCREIKVTAVSCERLPNPEDDGRIAVEAETAEEWKHSDELGWKLIPRLGRGLGALAEADKENAVLSYPFTILTPGKAVLEVHRFPSLDSVGHIRVGISVDNGEIQVLETESKDEHQGNWQENVRDNVDKIYLNLPGLSAGEHRIRFHAIDRYFAFSRFVIYVGETQNRNNLGIVCDAQDLPKEFDAAEFAERFYGAEALHLRPRPVHYLPPRPMGDTLTMEDIVIQPKVYGNAVTPEEIVHMGRILPREENGRILLETAAALAESEYARTGRGNWRYCSSPSHGETGLAMYLREAGLFFSDPREAPALRYRMFLQGGTYRIWVRLMMWGIETSHFALGVDGRIIPEAELYGGRPVWRYSNEQIWKWVPVYTAALQRGEHELVIYALCSHLRFEQIYITQGEELPPALVQEFPS